MTNRDAPDTLPAMRTLLAAAALAASFAAPASADICKEIVVHGPVIKVCVPTPPPG